MSCLCLSVVGNHCRHRIGQAIDHELIAFSPPWAGAHHRYVALQSLHSIQSTQIIYRKSPSVEVSRRTIIVPGVLIIISCWRVCCGKSHHPRTASASIKPRRLLNYYISCSASPSASAPSGSSSSPSASSRFEEFISKS